MKAASKPKPSPATQRKRALNLRVDGALADTFSEYCRKHRTAGSISWQVENFMLRIIAARGHRYDLRVPSHLLTK